VALKQAILRSAGQRFEQLFDKVLDDALSKRDTP
jgi:hypothetical protein